MKPLTYKVVFEERYFTPIQPPQPPDGSVFVELRHNPKGANGYDDVVFRYGKVGKRQRNEVLSSNLITFTWLNDRFRRLFGAASLSHPDVGRLLLKTYIRWKREREVFDTLGDAVWNREQSRWVASWEVGSASDFEKYLESSVHFKHHEND